MDPRDFKGTGPEVDNLQTGEASKLGVYVLRSKKLSDERQDEDDKFLEALSTPAADAFVRLGYEMATDSEAKDYRKKAEDAKEAFNDELRRKSLLSQTPVDTAERKPRRKAVETKSADEKEADEKPAQETNQATSSK